MYCCTAAKQIIRDRWVLRVDVAQPSLVYDDFAFGTECYIYHDSLEYVFQ